MAMLTDPTRTTVTDLESALHRKVLMDGRRGEIQIFALVAVLAMNRNRRPTRKRCRDACSSQTLNDDHSKVQQGVTSVIAVIPSPA
jgi:hypothetical protein